jgi:two-component system response regulator YesN
MDYTLLIAEDEQLERQALRFIVERNCPELRIVGETGDGASAVRLAEEQVPDIVLMDIRMPEMNGLEAAKQIRAGLPDAAIIMLTAFDEFQYAKQALTVGAVDYLLKPLRPDELVRVLRGIMDKVKQIRARQQEEAQLRNSLKEALPFVQMSFVYDLISGNIQDLEHLKERVAFLDMKALPAGAMVVDIDDFFQLTRKETELKKQLLKQSVFKEIVQTVGSSALVTPFGSDSIIVLMGSDIADGRIPAKEALMHNAKLIRDAVSRYLGISITIGIGRWYDDPREMYKSYLEALQAQRQRFFLGDNQIIHIEDVPHLDMGPFSYPFQHEQAVMDKIRSGDRKQAKEALLKLLDALFSSNAGIETIKACVLELLIVLSRAAVEGGANLEQLTLLNFDCISRLTRCSTGEQVYYWMMEALDRFMDNILENRGSMNRRIINKACEFILANCHRNISLEEAAGSVHLSPFYFSRLFKHEKGCTFVDFLTKVRVDKAKKMLKIPEYTIHCIASEAGYQDASYFCRVFRQETGMTPSQYRNNWHKKAKKPEV